MHEAFWLNTASSVNGVVETAHNAPDVDVEQAEEKNDAVVDEEHYVTFPVTN